MQINIKSVRPCDSYQATLFVTDIVLLEVRSA